ncbi:MAG: hypothetical protein ACE5HH_04775 [Candidatus Hydrothermarchaeales archaeon]
MKSKNIIAAVLLVALLSGCLSGGNGTEEVRVPKIAYVPEGWIVRENPSQNMIVVFEASVDPEVDPDSANYIEIVYARVTSELLGKDDDYEAQKKASTDAFKERLGFEPTEWTPIMIEGKKTPHMFGKKDSIFTCVDYSVHGSTLLKLYAQHQPGGELHNNLVRIAESITFE